MVINVIMTSIKTSGTSLTWMISCQTQKNKFLTPFIKVKIETPISKFIMEKFQNNSMNWSWMVLHIILMSRRRLLILNFF